MPPRHILIDRIEKLYALYNEGSFPHEAKSAFDLAQKLQKKYHIQDTEINKNKYKKSEPVKTQSSSSPKSHNWSYDYYNEVFGTTQIFADILSKSDKAILINVYLDPSYYVLPENVIPKVSIWYPKSKISRIQGDVIILDKAILKSNLCRNRDWIFKNHKYFKNISHFEFHLMKP